MLTFEHTHAPTVSYGCSLAKAIASYATDHLDEYKVFVVEVDTPQGVTIEVFTKTNATQACVRIH